MNGENDIEKKDDEISENNDINNNMKILFGNIYKNNKTKNRGKYE